MTDYYLKTPDAETMRAALDALPAEGITVDEIGKVCVVVDPEAGTVEKVDGYYANVRSDLDLEFPGIEVLHPETPWRVFA